MNSRVVTFCFISFSILLSASCGRSPLFNHKDEATDGAINRTATNSTFQGCELQWSSDQQTQDLCASLEWLQGPREGQNTIRLRFNIDPGSKIFDFWADMPDMGHGTAPVTIVKPESQIIVIEDLWFIMPGKWVLHFKLDGVEITKQVNI